MILAAAILYPLAAHAAKAPPVLHAAGNYFATPDGRAVLLIGNHTWTDRQDILSGPGPTNGPASRRFDFDGFVKWQAREGYTALRLWEWNTPTSGCGDYGHVSPLPWAEVSPGKFDLTRFDQAYFDRLRRRVQTAGAYGIYVSIMLFNVCGVVQASSSTNAWATSPFNLANNVNGVNGDPHGTGNGIATETLAVPEVWSAQKAYIARVIAAVSDLPNVLFEVANEPTGSDATLAWADAIVDFIHEIEAAGRGYRHPVGITDLSSPGASGPWTSEDYGNRRLLASHADWMSPNGSDRYKANPPDAPGTKVVISDTDHIFGIGGDWVWVWETFERGYNLFYMDDLAQTPLAPGTMQAGVSPLMEADEVSARASMSFVARVSAMLRLAAMKPHDALSSTGFALADPADGQFAVFAKNGGQFTVDLSACGSRTLDVAWMNLADGTRHGAGTVACGSAAQSFSAPYRHDELVLTPAT